MRYEPIKRVLAIFAVCVLSAVIGLADTVNSLVPVRHEETFLRVGRETGYTLAYTDVTASYRCPGEDVRIVPLGEMVNGER